MPAPNIFPRPGPRPRPAEPAGLILEVRRALMLHQSGRLAEAVAIYETVLKSHPAQFECLHYLGVARLQGGRPQEALPLLERALALRPDNASLQSNLGLALIGLGRLTDALRPLDRALALRRGLPEALNNKGLALRGLGRFEPALACFDEALAAQPESADLHHRRASCLAALHRHDEALAAFERALALRPDDADILGDLGTLLTLVGRAAPAREVLGRAAARAPGAMAHRLKAAVAWLPLVREAGDDLAAARAGFEAGLRALREEADSQAVAQPEEVVGAAQPFYLAYQPRNNVALLSLYGDLCARLMAQWAQAQGLPAPAAGPAAGDRVRVGIVCSQVFAHSVWEAIVRGWVAELDRSRFEVRVFHLGTTHDAQTDFARSRAEAFVEGLRGLPAWVQAIREARCDVLLYPELGMDPLTPRLAALRLAPVQAASWGHPETTGLPTLDHYLSAERFETEDGPLEASAPSVRYRESLVRLPGLGCCVAAPPAPTAAPAGSELGRLGVAPGATVFVCAGTPFKYIPEHDAVLVRIAQACPGAQFLFFRTPQVPALADRVRARLEAAFGAAGLDPRAHLVLAPWLERGSFLATLGQAHVFLDTIDFSGFNTVLQAIECGLPVVTRRGEFMRGRLGSGILEHLGCADLVAADEDAYVARAVQLGTQPAARAQAAARQQAARGRLYGDTAPIRALEAHLARWAGR